MTFKQDGNRLVGEGKFEEQTLARLFGMLSGAPPTSVRVRTVKLEANIVGRSGRFRLETEIDKTTLVTSPKSITVQGLLILADDGESFEVLEEHETEVKIYKAREIQS